MTSGDNVSNPGTASGLDDLISFTKTASQYNVVVENRTTYEASGAVAFTAPPNTAAPGSSNDRVQPAEEPAGADPSQVSHNPELVGRNSLSIGSCFKKDSENQGQFHCRVAREWLPTRCLPLPMPALDLAGDRACDWLPTEELPPSTPSSSSSGYRQGARVVVAFHPFTGFTGPVVCCRGTSVWWPVHRCNRRPCAAGTVHRLVLQRVALDQWSHQP